MPENLRPAIFAACLTALCTLIAPQAQAVALGFDLTLNYINPPTAQQQAIFEQAEATWESLIIGYPPEVLWSDISIDVTLGNIDGQGTILAEAGPWTAITFAGYRYTLTGRMKFDTSDLGSLTDTQFYNVVLHEMAHVIGFGALWQSNGVYTNGTGQYTGANALAAYQAEFDPLASYVPVELGGSTGTNNGHWNEADGGHVDTGLTELNPPFRDFQYELMTGWLDSPSYISDTTLQSFVDIGYVVAPEPSSLTLIGLGVLALARRRR